MATENTVSSPRIDRKFVDANGNLTPNAYALLYGLITRTGGVIAPIIDINSIDGRLNAVEVAPLAMDATAQLVELVSVLETLPAPMAQEPQQIDIQDTRTMALAAEVDQLRQRIEALEIGASP